MNKATRRLLAGAALGLIAGGPSRAADFLPPPIITATPVKANAVVLWNWAGLYVGGHIGAALDTTDIADPFGPSIYGDKVRSPGFIGGGQFGYNYQVGSLVLGPEADASGVISDGTNSCFAFSGFSVSSNCRVRSALYATLTGRLGYAVGPALLYVKGGAAWTLGGVNMFFNENNLGLGHTSAVFASTSSFDATGWTAGGGIEYALTPAWSEKLEYDYLDFSGHNVATPYVVGNPSALVAPITSAAQQVHQIKFGLNYRFGADSAALPAGLAVSPSKTPAFAPVSDWEAEAGARDMYSWGRFQKDHDAGLANGSSLPNGVVTSRLTYNDLQTNASELFGRVESPWNVFLKGYVGVGQTGGGNNNDEDSYVAVNGVRPPYSNSYSPKIDGSIAYAVADLGYDVIRNKDTKVGAFAGYSYLNQLMNRYDCIQIANPKGSCEAPDEPPAPPNVVRFQELDTWQALRIGLSSETMFTDRLKFSADLAYLPYVNFEGLDNHFRTPIAQFPAFSHGGQGAQIEALLSYYLSGRFAIGLGGRYWTMWTTNGQFTNPALPSVPRYYRAAFEQAGAFVQTAYTFGAEGKHTDAGFPQLFRASTAAQTDWSGLYVGTEGGGNWGRSKHINSGDFTADHATDITSEFAVNGGLFGGTLGYNARLGSTWLFGLEGDMSWTNAGGGSPNQPPFSPTSSSETREHWLSTARVRLGVVPVDRWLAYITGGVALAEVEAIADQTNGVSFSQSYIRPGWTVGAGIEYAIDRSWSAKLEYLHVGLNDTPYLNDLNPAVNGVNRGDGVPLSDEIIRVGINYKF